MEKLRVLVEGFGLDCEFCQVRCVELWFVVSSDDGFSFLLSPFEFLSFFFALGLVFVKVLRVPAQGGSLSSKANFAFLLFFSS